MPTLDLIARFIGIDAGAGREFDAIGAKASLASGSMAKFAKASTIGLAALAVGSIKAAADYQKLTVNLVTGAGEQQKNLKMVQSGMLSMAGQVGYSADTLAKAMYTVESAGFHGANALTLLKTAAQGAKVDNADLTTVTDALTSAMNAYHAPTADAAKVTNTLIASASVGKMHLQDLSAALGTVLPSAAALHVPLAQVGAAMATMTEQGTDASRAATYLRFSVAALANPTKKAQGEMAALGLTSQQVADKMMHGGLTGVFTLLEDAAGKKFPHSASQYFAALANMVGGTRGLQAVLELTGKHLGVMESNLGIINNRVRQAGNSVSDWKEIQKNFNQQLDEFAAGLQADAIAIGQHLLPVATDLLKVLSGTVHIGGDVVSFFKNNAVAAGALAAVLGGTLLPMVGAKLASAFETLALKAMYARDAIIASEAESAGFTAVMGGLVAAINPVTAALAAAAVAGYVFWKNSKEEAAAGKREVDAYVTSLHNMHDSIAASTQDTQAILKRLSDTALHIGSGNIDKTTAKFAEYANQAKSAITALQSMRSNEAELSIQFGISKAKVESLAKANGIDLSKSYSDVSQAMQAALSPTQQLTFDNTKLKKAVAGSANAVTALTDKLNILVGGPLAEHQNALNFAQGIEAITKAAKHNTGIINDNTKAGQQNAQLLQTQASNIEQSVSTWEKNGKSIDFVRKHLKDLEMQTITAMAATTGNRQAVIAYMRSMDLTPAEIDKVIGGVQKLATSMDNAKTTAQTDGTQTGSAYWHGLLQGIQQGLGPVGSAAANLAGQIDKNARQALQTGSPSKKAIQVGKWYAQGLAIGMTQGGKEVYLSATQVAHQLAIGLTEGFKGESTKVLNTFSMSVQSQMQTIAAKIQALIAKETQAVKTAHQTLISDLKARASAISSLQSSIAGNANISNVIGQATVGLGSNTTQVNYASNIKQYLGGEASLLKREAHLFGKLRKMGLSPALLAQISGLAPSDAIMVMQQIASGQDGSIRSLNNYENQIQTASRQIASGTINTPAEKKKLEQDRRNWHDLQHTLHSIEQHLSHLRTVAGKAGGTTFVLNGHSFDMTNVHDLRKLVGQLKKIGFNASVHTGKK